MPRAGRREESEAVRKCTLYVIDIKLALCLRARDRFTVEEHIETYIRNLVIGTGTEQLSHIKVLQYDQTLPGTCCCHPRKRTAFRNYSYHPAHNSFTDHISPNNI